MDRRAFIEKALADTALANVYIDISWDETAKYITSSPEAIEACARLIERFPDRFLFGTDEVAPQSQERYLNVYHLYAPPSAVAGAAP
jgi:predicted TIM-barrel fold metal-dependent hydrolase